MSTIILVPGWYVGPDGKCDLVSRRRVEGALALLREHPRAMVVFSGGCNSKCLGKGRGITEARAMFEYAVSQGLDPHRAWLEERATNTAQNQRFAQALVRQRVSGPTRWYVVSSDFQRRRHEALFMDPCYTLVRVATRARSLLGFPIAALWYTYGALMERVKGRRLPHNQRLAATLP